ncbi:MAG TPA: imidazole glycerol phosphate synthase subunit HisH [Pyrinomonadaceae bacterium]|nr:imidazole glycerol phosphate synthase subunit HisH [Pyrinomonadaceae bacterium]
MAVSIAIVDLGIGNLRSVWRGLNRVGVAASVVADARGIRSADKIILPGVGNFGRAMSGLTRLGILDALNEAVQIKKKPILGICLGMELMANRSEESGTQGLGWLNGNVVKLRPGDPERFKVPYIGWNRVNVTRSAAIMREIDENAEFYFLHSYVLELEIEDRKVVAGETVYETAFPSVIQRENIFGVQFHPEKSHDAGERVLRNFVEI